MVKLEVLEYPCNRDGDDERFCLTRELKVGIQTIKFGTEDPVLLASPLPISQTSS